MKIQWNRSCHLIVGIALATLPVMSVAQSDASSTSNQQSTSSSASGAKSGAENSTSQSSKMSMKDKTFVREAAQGGLAEVELGKLATEKASSDEVKKFGQKMVDDHTKANDQLKQVASSEGIELPQSMNAKDKALKDKLSKLSGADFDKAYMESMVKDHKNDVAAFTRESTAGKDEAVKQFASSTLPTLKSHLEDAQKIQPTTAKASSAGASQ